MVAISFCLGCNDLEEDAPVELYINQTVFMYAEIARSKLSITLLDCLPDEGRICPNKGSYILKVYHSKGQLQIGFTNCHE